MSGPTPLLDTELYSLFAKLGIVTSSAAMARVLRQAWKAAYLSDITLLIEGETGTGKQVLAQGIHILDQRRRAKAFVTVHCGTVSESLAESELFGHERGAFSGAVGVRRGLFQAAHGGTIFLDDVNDLPLNLQPKLLDVLQRGMVRPVGADKETPVDVRVISACNQALEPLVEEKRFREDLYHRLNVVKLALPPLRERKSDLRGLVLACAARHRAIYEPVNAVDADLIDFLERQPFPGNVRELEHGVERALFGKTEGNSLNLADWTSTLATAIKPSEWAREAASALWHGIFEQGISYDIALQEVERQLFEIAARRGPHTRRELASCLKTSERTVYEKLRSHKLSRSAPSQRSA
ncbi:MAG: sigma 54-interacting transcriptional regulator [Acidobacteriota bacterium]|nr:sigma 54-interacting transcriptional regulator [Acidobacteriota bacterium]